MKRSRDKLSANKDLKIIRYNFEGKIQLCLHNVKILLMTPCIKGKRFSILHYVKYK